MPATSGAVTTHRDDVDRVLPPRQHDDVVVAVVVAVTVVGGPPPPAVSPARSAARRSSSISWSSDRSGSCSASASIVDQCASCGGTCHAAGDGPAVLRWSSAVGRSDTVRGPWGPVAGSAGLRPATPPRRGGGSSARLASGSPATGSGPPRTASSPTTWASRRARCTTTSSPRPSCTPPCTATRSTTCTRRSTRGRRSHARARPVHRRAGRARASCRPPTRGSPGSSWRWRRRPSATPTCSRCSRRSAAAHPVLRRARGRGCADGAAAPDVDTTALADLLGAVLTGLARMAAAAGDPQRYFAAVAVLRRFIDGSLLTD